MSVHYKFKSALSFDTITFDGLHISIRDLKKAILQQKQIGKASDFDLQITNAQSNEVYEDDNVLVPKNSSLIVVRIPLTSQQKKASEKSDVLPALGGKGLQGDGLDPLANKLAKTVDLANVEASETDKIQAAITQSTLDYDPSNYLRIKGSNQVGELPANYRCYKCLQPGHWIRDCKLNAQPDSSVDIKKSTGIPRSFMVPVEGPEVPGAMMTPTGQFAVPSIEHEARKEPIRKVTEPVVVEKPTIPSDLVCGVCKDLLADAVLIPCCGNSFCDECIRNVLLESEDHQCPDCREKDVSPDTLIPNRFLRNSVNTFRNQTGYVKTPSKIISQPVVEKKISSPIKTEIPAEEPKVEEKEENRSSPTLSIKEHDLTKEDTRSPSDELEIVEDSSSSVVTPFPADINQQALSQGAAIPSLSNPLTSVNTEYDPHLNDNVVENLLPIPNIAVYSRSQPNPKICLKGEETGHHMRKDKSHFIINRHERSGTPTIDEHNHMDGPNRYRIESIGRMQPRLIPQMRQPPPMYNHDKERSSSADHKISKRNENDSRNKLTRLPLKILHLSSYNTLKRKRNYMYYPAPPMYLGPPRGPDMLLRMPHYGHQPPYNRSRTRPPYAPPQNGGQPGSIADPYEMFKKILKDKDRRRAKRRSRSISRSYSRSPTPRMRSRARSRTPRSRSRSRTRSRTRSRSRSRSVHYHERRKRTRSRSFTMSRSPYSDRSSPNRERHYASPRVRIDRHSPGYVSPSHSRSRNERHSPNHVSPNMRIRSDRHSPTYTSPTPRYYSQKYKDEIHRNQSKGSSDRRRHPTKSQDYYQSDYPRRSDRYEARYARERDHERERDKSDRDKDRTKYDDSLRALAAQDWEKTRDRELELRKRESREQELYEKTRKSVIKAVETIESTSREILLPPGVMLEEDRGRVLIDVKREPSNDIPLSKSPEKEKKSKEKKKRRKDEVDKKKKKKRSKDKGDKKEESFSTNDSIEPLIESPKEDVKDKEIKFEQIMDIFANESKEEPIPDKDVVLAPVPELSKWEKDEEAANPSEENIFPDNDDARQVTSEVIKRAENAIIFKKVNKPIESKKPERRVELAKKDKSESKIQQEKKPEIEKSRDNERRDERYREKNNEKDSDRRNKDDHQGRHSSKDTPRSVAVIKTDRDRQKSSDRKHDNMQPHRISAKERLGAKVEDKLVVKREIKGERREIKIEKMPPKSIVSKDSSRDRDKDREKEKDRERERDKDKEKEKVKKEIKLPEKIQIPEIKKMHAIEETFEPDYEKSDHEEKPDTIPPLQFDFKRAHSPESDKEMKKIKLALEEKSSTADSSLSSDDSDEKRHKKRKKSKKHKKRKKKRKHNSSSDSDSSSTSSDSDTDKRKKKHKHKSHKKSKKRKKSKK